MSAIKEEKIGALIAKSITDFIAIIPANMRLRDDLLIFVPYWALENLQYHLKKFTGTTVDIEKPFSMFSVTITVGYENSFVACVKKYGGIDEKAVFKQPIK